MTNHYPGLIRIRGDGSSPWADRVFTGREVIVMIDAALHEAARDPACLNAPAEVYLTVFLKDPAAIEGLASSRGSHGG